MGNKLGRKYTPAAKFLPDAPGKKHFCIIGAGSSGLVVMKELLALGHKVSCYELLPVIGGVYVKSYENTILTTSSLLTAWSQYSDGLESDPKFWTAEEYLVYLDAFAKKFGLYEHINFLTRVEQCRKDPETGKWLVTVRMKRGCEDGIRYGKGFPEDPNEPPRTFQFDGICCCAGTNFYSCLPTFPGQENFKGEIMHSEYYRNADYFEGKRVLVIGSGESGSDICNDISLKAAKTAIAIRGKHGHLIPRIQAHGRVTDLNTNRLRYSNPYIFGDWIGYVNQLAKRFFASIGPKTDLKKVLLKIGELNIQNKSSAFSKFGCKNEGFVKAMVLRGAELHRDNFVLQENKAVFEDGTEFVCDSIVACTGYRNAFPYFDEYHEPICYAGMNPRTNYKQIFSIDYPGEIGFFGFARPAFGSIPPTTEMQARLFALVVNGEIELPSKEEMRRVAAADKLNWETRFGYDSKRVKGLVDYQVYCDGLAKIMGCMPPLVELFWKKPYYWFKIMFGPFTVHQYRLTGPYPTPERAYEVYRRTPVGDLVESVITASFLVLAKTLTLLGFDQFTPNEF